jgi:hypothetical protein
LRKNKADACCPRFNPEPWDDKTLTWENRRFRERPSNKLSSHSAELRLGHVNRNVGAIESTDASPETMVSPGRREFSLGSDVYIEVTKVIPGANMATISGTFLSKVFEGAYQSIRKWID